MYLFNRDIESLSRFRLMNLKVSALWDRWVLMTSGQWPDLSALCFAFPIFKEVQLFILKEVRLSMSTISMLLSCNKTLDGLKMKQKNTKKLKEKNNESPKPNNRMWVKKRFPLQHLHKKKKRSFLVSLNWTSQLMKLLSLWLNDLEREVNCHFNLGRQQQKVRIV